MIRGAFLSLTVWVWWSAGSLVAGDWPQFRGPNGRAIADDVSVPTRWSLTPDKRENIRWVAELPGRGLSSVVVADGRVYVTACDGPDQTKLITLCFDARSGKKLWQRSILATGGTNCHPKTCMAAPTPVTDGKHVFALFATADLVAYDRDGNLLWYRSLTGDYPSITNQVGMASSPILAQGRVIVPMDNSGESFLAAVDAQTGKNVWRIDRPRDINWVTPLLRGDEIIFQNPEELVAYDVASGERRWSFAEGRRSEIPSPILGPGGEILSPGSELIAVEPSKPGETPRVRWKSSRLRGAAHPTPLVYRNRVFALNGSFVLQCGDATTGKHVWDLRLKGPISASPVAANGRVYVVNEQGQTFVIRFDDKEGSIEATNHVNEEILATPAIADGAIFLRSDKKLICIRGD
ncbi:MAG: PQQ-binding-like beta-propeller repeat protein [Gemmataceae bacterium]|nr:PQQ-binding-like beta-propeller repeat protein [Gemmataceae bacterium]